MSDLGYVGIAEAGRLFRSGRLSPVELVRALVSRVERLDSECHAFLDVTAELALAQAAVAEREIRSGADRGPLHGIPYGLKDIIDVKGLRTTCHSKILADNIAERDATVVSRLRQCGAVLLGKTALHEFAVGGPAFDLPWPPALNPWDLERHPGGSSSGSAAALSAGLVPAAIGTDTGGSVRHPATCCGIVGMKPTYGLVSLDGVFPLSTTLDHVGPMTRNVEDNVALLQAIAGTRISTSEVTQGIRGLKIGLIEHFYTKDEKADEVVIEAIDDSVRILRSLGATVEPAFLPPLGVWKACGKIIQEVEQYAVHKEWLERRPHDYCSISRTKLMAGATLRAHDYEGAIRTRRELIAEFSSVFTAFDALTTASSFHLPAAIRDAAEVSRTYGQHARMPFNVTGTPAIAVPAGFSAEGLPLGLQIAGRAHDEATLYRIAWALCNETGFTSRRAMETRGT